jgi:hypothetical protein
MTVAILKGKQTKSASFVGYWRKVMIHRVNNYFLISSCQTWMPGAYESEGAARYAFRFCEDHLLQLRDEAVQSNGGIITMAAMKRLQKEHGFSCGQGLHRAAQ